MGGGAFRLQKWYGDCVTSDGGVVICYVGVLQWGLLRLRYAATLEQDAPGTPLRHRQRWSGGRVIARPGSVEMASTGLGLLGTWQGGTSTEEVVVASVGGRDVRWRALTLAARANVTTRSGRFEGEGYSEVVVLTLPPWRLPFRQLAWGRFVSRDAVSGLTWIRTSVGTDFAAAWHPQLSRVSQRPGEVAGDGWRLLWDAERSVRSAGVPASLFGRLRPLAALLPRRLRGLTEDKRLAPGRLVRDGAEVPGWVIHEDVRWG